MQKPAQIRAALSSAIPFFKTNPAQVAIIVETGKLRAREPIDSFEYNYTLTILITDYTAEPETIFIPLLNWAVANELTSIQSHEKANDLINFDIAILDDGAYDIEIKMDLSEAIKLTKTGGHFSAESIPEPTMSDELRVDLGLPPLKDLIPNYTP